MDFYEKEVERIDHPRRASLEPSVVPGPPTGEGDPGENAAEDHGICSGDGITDEWLSSWYPETHMSQKMVIEAKREEMERSKRRKFVSWCHKGIQRKGR